MYGEQFVTFGVRMQDPASAFKRLKRSVESTKTPAAQVNEIVRFLHAHSYAKAAAPEGAEVWAATKAGERPSKLMFFIWLDTPFGDDLVLMTGPSYTPRVVLGASIPSSPGVGVYVQGLVAKFKTGDVAQRKRVAARTEVVEEAASRGGGRGGGRAPRPGPSRPGMAVATEHVVAGQRRGESKRATAEREHAQREAAATSQREQAAIERRSVAAAEKRARDEAAEAERAKRAADAEAADKLRKAEAAAAKIQEQEDDSGATEELGSLADILRKKLGL